MQSKLLVYTLSSSNCTTRYCLFPRYYTNQSQEFFQKNEFDFFNAEYGDLEALLTGLRRKEVEGVLLDVFTASYIFNKEDISDTDMFEQVTILEYPFHIGLYMMDYKSCLKPCIQKEVQQDKTWIYPYVLKHIKGQTVKVSMSLPIIIKSKYKQ